MIDPLAQDVKRALTTFVAEVIASAERRAIEAIQSAFREMSRPNAAAMATASNPAPTATAVHNARSPSAPRPEDRRPLSRDDTAIRARLKSCLQQSPGLDTQQLAELLNLKTYQVRRLLRAMVQDAEILFDVATVGGLRRRTYYVVEPLAGSEPGPPQLPMGMGAAA